MYDNQNKRRYSPPPSRYEKSPWIDTLKLIYKIIFCVIILAGIILCGKADDTSTGIIILGASLVAAVLAVGFVIVFLDIAGDIRDMVNYVYQIGAMIIEDKNRDVSGDIENTAENIYQIKTILENNTAKKE